MERIRSLYRTHSLLLLTIFFFIFRLSFLTRLPIFNDEAIYLDWGWKELHIPGALFYSLIDGKQPLLMWVFGISQILFSDPLFAGRFVAVISGFLTMLGIYTIGMRFLSKRVAFLSSILYLIIPLFSSYDRLALMESSISACSIWTIYFLLKLIKEQKSRYAVLVGVVLGIGFFVKSTMLIFLITSFLILGVSLIKRIIPIEKLCTYVLIMVSAFFAITFLLFLQPLFWQSLSMNDRYSLTFSELLSFPIIHFIENLYGNFEILFIFITPFIALLGFIGSSRLLKKDTLVKNLTLWFFIALFLQTLLVRGTTQRYVVSFLPLLCLFAAYELENWRGKLKKAYPLVLGAVILIPLLLTSLQMVNPVEYVKRTLPLSKKTESGLVYGQVSGYGITEIVEKVKANSKGQPLVVATAINIGNPESAMHVYFHKSDEVKVGFLDRRMFGEELNQYECIRPQIPLLYVSREFQQSEMNEYLTEVGRVKHPYSDYSLGLYMFKTCEGKVIDFNPYLLTQ